MEEHVPLMAVLTGRFMEDACEKMGRPLDVVLQELAWGRGEGPEQPPSEPLDGI